jgi:peptide methionine sulfoxide reductase msrA/msrB
MQNWNDVVDLARNGNPAPPSRVEKTEEKWKTLLTPEQFHVAREKGTERAHSSSMCNLFEAGQYACICCRTVLFDSTEKFQSGTGWPSFTQPVAPNVVAYHGDESHGMMRVEVTCNVCDAHLGHVFPDGPAPSGLRFCINAVSLVKVKTDKAEVQNPSTEKEALATFGGGCFWCTEAVFQQLKGVSNVESGYSGGSVLNPTYEQVCGGRTGHAEVIQVTYDPTVISYEDLICIHLATHDPTTLNRQGADHGTQYRSAIFYRTDAEKETAERTVHDLQELLGEPVVTKIEKLDHFYKAETYHQNYFADNAERPYCQAVIKPKLKKFREMYVDRLA